MLLRLDQEERSRAVDAFRRGIKDVLVISCLMFLFYIFYDLLLLVKVATDVASKGLDFAEIQHVINYDMPDDIENYGN